ncbi:hypothetical protein D3C87_1147970 [compost metagenome]
MGRACLPGNGPFHHRGYAVTCTAGLEHALHKMRHHISSGGLDNLLLRRRRVLVEDVAAAVGDLHDGCGLDALALIADDSERRRHLKRTHRRGPERKRRNGLHWAVDAHAAGHVDDVVRPNGQDRIDRVDIVGCGDRLTHVDLAEVFFPEIARAVCLAVPVVVEHGRLAVEHAGFGHFPGR